MIQILNKNKINYFIQNIKQLILIFKIEEVFQSITKKVNKNNKKKLIIIKTIIIQKIYKILQEDYCEDPLNIIYLKIIKRFRFLKNRSIFLLNRRLILLSLKKTI